MSEEPTSLPRAYTLVHRRRVDSVLAEAARLAGAGAPEGTLVWADEQTDATGPDGAPWPSPPGNLYCTVLVRPESNDPDLPAALLYSAVVSMGNACAELVPPMTGLSYRWPGGILLNGAAAALVQLEGGPGYLIVSLFANVNPVQEDPAVTSLASAGAEQPSAGALLERFARHLASWLDRWSDEGLAPLLRAWMQRRDTGEPLSQSHLPGGAVVRGRFLALEDDGSLTLDLADGARRTVAVRAAYPGLSPVAEREVPPGVYHRTAEGDVAVHRYQGGEYGLEDVVTHFGLGRIVQESATEVELVLTADELHKLRLDAHAFSFDYEEAFIEMCLELERYASTAPADSYRFVASF